MPADPPPAGARERLLDAAIARVRRDGFAATSVGDLCREAGVTKGAFFHHFESKAALGAAAARHWSETTAALFAAAPYHAPADPLDRVLAYVAFRRALIQGTPAEFCCYAGTLAQEVHAGSEPMRQAAEAAILDHAATLEADIAAAVEARGLAPDGWTPRSLARHTQTVLQGAFVMAKATGDAAVALDAVDHLDRYVRLLFADPAAMPEKTAP